MSQKIVFMGTPEFAVPTLEILKNSKHKVLTVYSQPAKKAKRGQKKIPSIIENFAKELSLKIRTPLNLDTDEEYEFLKEIEPDIVIVVAYGKIIPKRFLSLPKHGFINLHASLLPKWRGAAPIQRSIMNLDSETGISIIKINEKLDAGPVMQQDRVKLNENIDYLTLSKVLSKLGAKKILEAVDKLEKGIAEFSEQNHSQATYAKKISKEEGEVKWDDTANKILAKINGIKSNPGAWFMYKNKRYKIWKAEIVNQNGETGKTIDNDLTIACKDKSIKILEIQKEGKDKQSADNFLLGNKIIKGEKIK